MAKKSFLLLVFFYGLILASLFLYSFTQIDLNLTLSQDTTFQSIQKFFIQIGYFQRPLSTLIFLILTSSFFIFYPLIIWMAAKNKISRRRLWKLIGLSVIFLFFSYPAFSHDLFNYIFDARIFTKYSLNPYYFKPLDFPYDSWTRFMHWTHRNYPYGPSWLIISLPFSYLGFGKFLLTLLNFKVLVTASYLGSIYFIEKILGKTDPSKQTLGVAFFAFNPLVVIETLVSAHHDMVMMFFALSAIYLIVVRKKTYSFFAFAFSVGVKYTTAPLIPLLILGFRQKLAVFLSVLGLFYVLTQREIQPWYFLWVLPIVALNPRNRFFSFLAFGFSLGLLLRYAPFLYLGHWNDPVPQIKLWVTAVPVVLAFLFFLVFKTKKG